VFTAVYLEFTSQRRFSTSANRPGHLATALSLLFAYALPVKTCRIHATTPIPPCWSRCDEGEGGCEQFELGQQRTMLEHSRTLLTTRPAGKLLHRQRMQTLLVVRQLSIPLRIIPRPRRPRVKTPIVRNSNTNTSPVAASRTGRYSCWVETVRNSELRGFNLNVVVNYLDFSILIFAVVPSLFFLLSF
jgi:hypothetical protein